MKKAKVILIILLTSIIIVLGLTIGLYNLLTSAVSKDETEIKVEIPLGSTSGEIAKILKENKLIRNELIFKLYVKINKVSNFQAGNYYLKRNMSIKEISNMLKTGIMYDPNQINITYIEGKKVEWLATVIEQKTNNKKEDVLELFQNEEYINSLIEKYWFIDKIVKDKNIYYSLEGYLFPDTYTIQNKDVKVEEIFEKMIEQMQNKLEKYKSDIENSTYSIHEILTIASIIEMESMTDEGRKDVSSVIYNRLDANMPIQSDVTTYYAFKVNVGDRDLYQKEINTYNPYNTRGPNMQGRLPIGPICSVSEASIEAAIYPNNTDYFFFVADKNGKLYFTKTDNEHSNIIYQLREKGLWLEY